LSDLKYLVESERDKFIRFIYNGSWNSPQHRENIDLRLLDYEQVAGNAEYVLNFSTHYTLDLISDSFCGNSGGNRFENKRDHIQVELYCISLLCLHHFDNNR